MSDERTKREMLKNLGKGLGIGGLFAGGMFGYIGYVRAMPNIVDYEHYSSRSSIIVRVDNNGGAGEVRTRILFYDENGNIINDKESIDYFERDSTRDIEFGVSLLNSAETYKPKVSAVNWF